MVSEVIDRSGCQVQAFFEPPPGAARLGGQERKELSVKALAGMEPIAQLAADNEVSRKFVYEQAAKADEALDEAFAPSSDDKSVLYYIPVTKPWIRQLILELVLVCHSSFRGAVEFLRDVLDYPVSVGTVHNVVAEYVQTARRINSDQDLSSIRVGAHDEIFQAGRPVLVGADIQSTFCYLLAAEDHRDQTTWGVHLLDLTGQGLRPDHTIADAGQGLRAGQAAAWEGVPCHGDVFHPEYNLGKLVWFLDNRASAGTTARKKLQRKMERLKRRGARTRTVSARLAAARRAEVQAIALAQDVRILADWIQKDILSLAGPDLATRRELFDFIVEQLRQREALCAHRIVPVRRMLEGQRDDLLAFAGLLDERFAEIAPRLNVPLYLVHAVCELQGLDPNQSAYWQRETQLRQKLRHRFHSVQSAVRQVMRETPRASSIIENLNSRLRNYFFLRRHIGDGYLELLRFFLNHRRFLRSECPQRVGKSPAELLTGQPHPHWLELLGFQRFRRN